MIFFINRHFVVHILNFQTLCKIKIDFVINHFDELRKIYASFWNITVIVNVGGAYEIPDVANQNLPKFQ